MEARMFVYPKYVLEVDGKRVTLPRVAGAAVARMFRSPGHYVSMDDLVEAAYFDDPDGGPLSAAECVKICLWQSRKKLTSIGVKIQGWRRLGGHRLLFPWHNRKHLHRACDLPPLKKRGAYIYVSKEVVPHSIDDLPEWSPPVPYGKRPALNHRRHV